VAELVTLATTVSTWETEILAYHHTGRASNGPTEAVNLLIEKTRRIGHGFRNFNNYRLRLLLACGVPWNTAPVARLRGRQPRLNAQSPICTHCAAPGGPPTWLAVGPGASSTWPSRCLPGSMIPSPTATPPTLGTTICPMPSGRPWQTRPPLTPKAGSRVPSCWPASLKCRHPLGRTLDLVDSTTPGINTTPAPTGPPGPCGLTGEALARFRVRQEDIARIEDPGWADRSSAEIGALSELAWAEFRADQPDSTGGCRGPRRPAVRRRVQ